MRIVPGQRPPFAVCKIQKLHGSRMEPLQGLARSAPGGQANKKPCPPTGHALPHTARPATLPRPRGCRFLRREPGSKSSQARLALWPGALPLPCWLARRSVRPTTARHSSENSASPSTLGLISASPIACMEAVAGPCVIRPLPASLSKREERGLRQPGRRPSGDLRLP